MVRYIHTLSWVRWCWRGSEIIADTVYIKVRDYRLYRCSWWTWICHFLVISSKTLQLIICVSFTFPFNPCKWKVICHQDKGCLWFEGWMNQCCYPIWCTHLGLVYWLFIFDYLRVSMVIDCLYLIIYVSLWLLIVYIGLFTCLYGYWLFIFDYLHVSMVIDCLYLIIYVSLWLLIVYIWLFTCLYGYWLFIFYYLRVSISSTWYDFWRKNDRIHNHFTFLWWKVGIDFHVP